MNQQLKLDKTKSKYQIWDCGILVPAYTRKPKDARAIKKEVRTIQEAHVGIRYYIPASNFMG